jgi:putative addiction module component (TIGR02574 family)
MSVTLQNLGIDQLGMQERLDLIGEIWDSIDLHETPIPESHRLEIDRRLSEAKANPHAGRSWEEVRTNLEAAE